MKRRERKVLFRVVNAISSIVLVASAAYLYFIGISVLAVSCIVISLCCIGAPVVTAGEGVLEVFVGFAEALFHAVIDAVVGIFEAIGNAFSSIG